MPEILFILIVIFVAYLVYKPRQEQKKTRDLFTRRVEPEPAITAKSSQPASVQPITTTVSQKKLKNVAPAIKPSSARLNRKNTKATVSQPVAMAKEMSVPERVGLTAGIIWNYLNKNGATTVSKLLREIQEDEKTIQRSIGWLAQEGKITLKIIKRAETVALKE